MSVFLGFGDWVSRYSVKYLGRAQEAVKLSNCCAACSRRLQCLKADTFAARTTSVSSLWETQRGSFSIPVNAGRTLGDWLMRYKLARALQFVGLVTLPVAIA